MLRQITYISTARSGFDDALFREIERHAQRWNAAMGLSGLLMFDGVRFLQVLEGHAGAVQSTFERIADDPRHFALVTLRDQQVEERSFGGWAMLCQNVSTQATPLTDLIAPFVRDADKTTRALFESFAEIRGSRAA